MEEMKFEILLADLSLRIGIIEKILVEKGLTSLEDYTAELSKSVQELTNKINASMKSTTNS